MATMREIGDSWEKIDRSTARRQFFWLIEACALIALGSFLVFA